MEKNTEGAEVKEEKLFSTRDLYLASALQTMKFPVLRIDMQIEGIKPRAIGYFNFEETEELRNARREYNQGEVTVEPRMYINNLQSLKAEVVNMQQNPMNTQR